MRSTREPAMDRISSLTRAMSAPVRSRSGFTDGSVRPCSLIDTATPKLTGSLPQFALHRRGECIPAGTGVLALLALLQHIAAAARLFKRRFHAGRRLPK